jgi:hypothetical protein
LYRHRPGVVKPTALILPDFAQNAGSTEPVKWIPHYVLGIRDDDLMPSLTAELSILRWTKTLKCIGPKPLTSRFVNSQFPGTLALWLKDKKIHNLHSTLHTVTCGQVSLDYWEKMEIWARNVLRILIEGHGQKLYNFSPTLVTKHLSVCGASKMMLLEERATVLVSSSLKYR